MTRPGITGVGAYAPRLRVTAETVAAAWGRFDAAGIETTAVPEADEDALTMAVAAGRRALTAAGVDPGAVAHLAFATTTPPLAEGDLTARLTSVLGTPETAHTQTVTGSTRAGAQALVGALEAGPWGEQVGLVVASDCPRGAPDSGIEHAAGAGAGALVLAADGPAAVTEYASHSHPAPGGRFRRSGETETPGLGVTAYDRETFTSTLGRAADQLDSETTADAAAVQSPDGKLPYRAASTLGVETETVAAAETVSSLGDTGVASVFLGLASALEEGARSVLLGAYGDGAGATVARVEGAVPVTVTTEGGERLDYPAYLRRRGEITREEPAGGGAYVSVPTWQQTIPQRHRLVAGRCPDCRALNIPPEGACRVCRHRPETYPTVDLPGTGTVEAATRIEQGGAPPEFVPQQSQSGPYVSAVVALDGPDGETVSVPAQVIAGGQSVDIGTPVTAVVRRLYTQEGVTRYGFKMQVAGLRA